jgi:AICAR transformylase/IMP cyclohydrolase PurH
VSLALRRELAAETFRRVSAYDDMIARYLAATPL